MEIFKICAVLLSAALIAVIIKEQNRGMHCLISVTGTLIASFFAIQCISPIIEFLSGIDSVKNEIFQAMLKVLGISLLTEISSSMCRDVGETSLAVGIDLCGKAEILILSLPLFKELIELCINLLN